MSNVEIWTDGSCSAKDRVGGWGAVIIINAAPLDPLQDDQKCQLLEIELSGSAVDTTVNAMEAGAVLKALSAIATPSDITIYTDSEYVRKGILHNGWVDRGPSTPNYKLWCRMNKVINHHLNVKPIWVRGHTGVYGNERADTLAGNARKRRLRRLS